MQYNFDQIVERENTNCVKYDVREWYFGKKDVIPMWVADMDFETPEFIREAVLKRASHPIYGYSIKPESYYQAIIQWLQNSHQWQVNQSEICFSPGVVPGFTMAILAFTQPGDKIVVQTPVYFPFFSSILDTGRQLVHNELIENDNYYTIDFEDLEEKLSDSKTKVFMISSPHNPVGRVWNKEELNKMIALCEKHHVLLFSDEIHCDLILPDYKHIVTAHLNEFAKQNTITFMAPSKTFNMAGLSTSFLVIQNPVLKQQFDNLLNAYHLGGGNVFGTVALEAAYNYGRPWLNELMEYLQKNIDYLDDFLKSQIPQISFAKPEATYLVWLNCKSLNLNDEDLVNFFIHKAGLGLNKGSIFGLGGSGYMRMNLACPRAILEKSLFQLKEAIINFKKESST